MISHVFLSKRPMLRSLFSSTKKRAGPSGAKRKAKNLSRNFMPQTATPGIMSTAGNGGKDTNHPSSYFAQSLRCGGFVTMSSLPFRKLSARYTKWLSVETVHILSHMKKL